MMRQRQEKKSPPQQGAAKSATPGSAAPAQPTARTPQTPALAQPPEALDQYPRRMLLLAMLLLTLLAVLPYYGVVHQDFVNFDDDLFVYQNPIVRNGLNWDGIVWSFGFVGDSQWHPLMWMSHMLDVSLFGLWAGGHKLHNLALHVGITLLLFTLFRRATGMTTRAFVLAALFTVHPLRVEVVAWVAERKELLSTFFGLLTLLAYVGYARRPGFGRYLLVVLAYALTLLSKPMLVTLPGVMLLMDVWPLGRIDVTRWRTQLPKLMRLIAEKAVFVPMVLFAVYATLQVVLRHGAMANPPEWPLRLSSAAVAYCWYIWKLFAPTDLTILYLWRWDWPLGLVLSCLAGLVFVTWLVLRLLPVKPYLAVGWLWFLGVLVPVIGLVQAGSQSYADRYSYVSHIGLLIILVWGLAELSRNVEIKRRILITITAASLLVLVAISWLQTSYWYNSITLWTHALDVDPANATGQSNLGLAYLQAGDRHKAIYHFEEALRTRPGVYEASMNLASMYIDAGDYRGAVRWYQQAAKFNPDKTGPYYGLGIVLLHLENFPGALEAFGMVIELTPRDAKGYYGRGVALMKMGRDQAARDALAKAVELWPTNFDYQRELGLAYQRLKQPGQAAIHLSEALRLNPADDTARKALQEVESEVR